MSKAVRVRYEYEELNIVRGEMDIPIEIWEDTDAAVGDYILKTEKSGDGDWDGDTEIDFIEIVPLTE